MKIIIYIIVKTVLSICAVFGILYFSLSDRIELLLLFALSTWIVATTNMINLFDEEINDYLFKRKTKANSLEGTKDYGRTKSLAAIIGNYNEDPSFLIPELNVESEGIGMFYCPCCCDDEEE